MANSTKQGVAKSTRFGGNQNEDDEDFVLNDEDDANEQLEKMRKLESERKKGGKPPLSGLSKGREGLTTASTRVVDLTAD